MNMNHDQSKPYEITLMDIFIVGAIIVIVAVFIFPIFAKARVGRHNYCASNERQLGLGFAQYIQDYDDKYPCGLFGKGNGEGWGSQIYGYIKATGVYVCSDEPLRFVCGA